MHMFSVEHGFYGGHGIVGAQVALGTGLAFKHQYSGDGGVCLAYFGDGAANQGQVYESFNMASCGTCRSSTPSRTTNMRWAPAVERSAPSPFLQARRELPDPRHPGRRHGRAGGARRGRGGDGLDRSGKGPIILELKTYRYRGHSMSDPAKYRTREEVQIIASIATRSTMPPRSSSKLGVKEDELKAIDKEIKDIVVEAAKFAEEAPEPDAAELYTDVLVESY